MNPNGLKAIVDPEEFERRREESLAVVLEKLRADPERFRPRCGPASFPARPRRDGRRALPDCLRAAPKRAAPLPSRLPWELLPAPEKERVRTKTVYRTLPAGSLAEQVRQRMKERNVTMEQMALTLHIAPVTLRKWLRCPDMMTVRDYGELVRWLNRGAPERRNGL